MQALKTLYTRYSDLTVSVLKTNPPDKSNPYGYRFTVQSNLINNVTAFKAERDLRIWLEDRGLELRGTLPSDPEASEHYIPVAGEFIDACTLDIDSFDELWRAGLPKVVVMDNGEHTVGLSSTSVDGGRVIHYLNCNIRTRPQPLGQGYSYEANKACLEALLKELDEIARLPNTEASDPEPEEAQRPGQS